MSAYKLIRPLLFAIDSEAAHDAMLDVAEVFGKMGVGGFIKTLYSYEHPALRTTVFGKEFANPVGLAAGFDKNARAVDFLPALGFGFLEVGTITPRPQVGNPQPRLFRLPQDHALINRMGFNNGGMEVLAKRIAARSSKITLGINIGKNKDTPNEQATDDYVKSFIALRAYADYVVVNVSSPNTPGLRTLQDKGPLTELLTELQRLNYGQGRPVPMILKIAPDLTDPQLDDIVEIVRGAALAGVIATNTTISRDGLKTSTAEVEKIANGGLSGRPLTKRSTEVVRYLFKKLGKEIPIIGVGGVFSAEDAYEKIKAGAALVQVYSGLIYEGPGLVKEIKRGLVRLLERDGFKSVRDAVGTAANH